MTNEENSLSIKLGSNGVNVEAKGPFAIGAAIVLSLIVACIVLDNKNSAKTDLMAA